MVTVGAGLAGAGGGSVAARAVSSRIITPKAMPTQLIGVRRVFGSAPGTAASAAAEAARWTSANGSSCSRDSVDHGSGSLTVIASAMKATAQPIADGARAMPRCVASSETRRNSA